MGGMMTKQKVKEVISTEGCVEVTSTVLGKPQTKRKQIKIRPFVTVTAQVEVHKGAWFPTGDMRGAKLDITVRVPCYIEEIPEIYRSVNALVDKLMEKEYRRLSGEDEDEED
jgi:hypothetical protein